MHVLARSFARKNTDSWKSHMLKASISFVYVRAGLKRHTGPQPSEAKKAKEAEKAKIQRGGGMFRLSTEETTKSCMY